MVHDFGFFLLKCQLSLVSLGLSGSLLSLNHWNGNVYSLVVLTNERKTPTVLATRITSTEAIRRYSSCSRCLLMPVSSSSSRLFGESEMREALILAKKTDMKGSLTALKLELSLEGRQGVERLIIGSYNCW